MRWFSFEDHLFFYDISVTISMIRYVHEYSNTNNIPATENGSDSTAQTNAGTANSETTGAMDENKAFEIALKHANVAANDVGEKSVKKDFDDDYNKEIYEVNFKVGNMEYDYDIAVDTGEILKAESEIDD